MQTMRDDIPGGHQLQVTSWENAADSYGTQIISGLTPNDVKFYVEFLQPFKSRKSGGVFGNGGVALPELTLHLSTVYEKHKHGLSKDLASLTEAAIHEEGAYEFVTDLLGTPHTDAYWDEVNFCRVFDLVKVVYFPHGGKDVTSQFV